MFSRLKCAIFLPLFLAAGAAGAGTTVHQVDLASLVPHCDRPIGTVFVTAIDCKASGCGQTGQGDGSRMGQLLAMAAAANGQAQVDISRLGDGATEALESALKATGCFTVQDRANIQALKDNASLTGMTFTPKPADWMLTGAITSVAVNTKSTQVAGGLIPVIGGFKNTKVSASMTINISVLDTKSAEVLQSQSFAANSEKSNWGLGGAGFGPSGALFGSTSTTNSPELDSVANDTVISAANYITTSLAVAAVTRQAEPPAAAAR